MKNRWIVYLVAIFWVTNVGAQSDDCTPFFTFEEGTQWEMSTYNKKDKLQNKISYIILSVKEEGATVSAVVRSELFDRKGKSDMEMDYTVSCSGGVYSVDLSSVMTPHIVQAFQGMEADIEGQEMTLPSSLSVGQQLPDANTKITVSSSGIQIMSTTVTVTGREVTGEKEITVPAGTYKSYEVTSTQALKAGFISRDFKTVDYFSPKIGMVRTETYDKKGNLESYMVLSSFSK